MAAGNTLKVMKRAFLTALMLLSVCAVPLPATHSMAAESADYFLYLPESVDPEVGRSHDDGVLVRKIVIRRGDTLSRLSRQYSGKGRYYPQILLFNQIADPDLIYAGRELLVPVSRPGAEAKAEKSAPVRKSLRSRKSRRSASREARRGGPSVVASPEALLFRRAVALFDSGKYREAIDNFTRFLEEYPHSSLAAEARLHRADSYLRLSDQ